MGKPQSNDQHIPEAIAAARTVARLSRSIESACREHGLNLQQYRLLVFISRSPQRAGVVARQGAVSRPSLTGLVDGLESRGLVSRTPVESDRRGIQLELTDEGRALLAATEEQVVRRFGSHFTGEDGQTALATLASLEERLDPRHREG